MDKLQLTKMRLADHKEAKGLTIAAVKDIFRPASLNKYSDNSKIAAGFARFYANYLAGELEKHWRSNYYLVARSGQKIVGIIAHGPVSKTITDLVSIDQALTQEIKSAYVLPTYQGRGIGSLLFNGIKARLKKHGVSKYCLFSGFPQGQVFWQKKLGKPAVIKKAYFKGDFDCLIWYKDLHALEK